MNLISPKLQQNLHRSVSPSSQFSGHLQQSVPSPGGPPAGLAGSSGGRGGVRGAGKGRCGRKAASGPRTQGVANVPGRGPGRSWGPLGVGKSEKYFPKLVFGQLQPTLSNDTKQSGIWMLQFFNPNRCLPTRDLLSPSQDALSAFSSLYLLKPGRELPTIPLPPLSLGNLAVNLPACIVPVAQTAPLRL